MRLTRISHQGHERRRVPAGRDPLGGGDPGEKSGLGLAIVAALTLGVIALARADVVAGDGAFEPRDYALVLEEWEQSPRAAAWYQLAAEKGDPRGQFELGMTYLKGKGVKRDPAEGARLIRDAAEQGLAEAQYQLGLLFRRGLGVEADPAEGARWHRRAAQQGFALAMARLGSMYFEGVGVAKDPVEAYVWFSLAVDRGVAAARGYVKAAGKRLGPERLAEAKKILAERKARIKPPE